MQKTKKKFNFAINICVLVTAVILATLFLEFILGKFFQQNLNQFELDSILGYKGIPNKKVRFIHQDFDTTVELNNHGLRDNNHDYNSNKYRILVLGDSMTFGYGVENNETYSKILEKKLKEEGEYEVINAGITGYNTNQELAFLDIEGWKYSPDLIIVGFMLNDIVTNYYDDSIFALENGELFKKYSPNEISSGEKVRNYLSSNSHVYNFVKNRLGIRSKRTQEQDERKEPVIKTMLGIDDPIIEKGFEKTFLLVDKLKETAEKQNAELLIVLIATKEQVDENELKELLELYNFQNVNTSKNTKVVVKYLEDKDIKYIDLLPEFRIRNRDNDFYYENDGHLNARGQELVAEIIYEKLKQGLILENGD